MSKSKSKSKPKPQRVLITAPHAYTLSRSDNVGDATSAASARALAHALHDAGVDVTVMVAPSDIHRSRLDRNRARASAASDPWVQSVRTEIDARTLLLDVHSFPFLERHYLLTASTPAVQTNTAPLVESLQTQAGWDVRQGSRINHIINDLSAKWAVLLETPDATSITRPWLADTVRCVKDFLDD